MTTTSDDFEDAFEDALVAGFEAVVEDVRANADMNAVKASIYARMRARRPVDRSGPADERPEGQREKDLSRPFPQPAEGQSPRPYSNPNAPSTMCEVSSETVALLKVHFLTVPEVSVAMGVTQMAVYRLVHSGELTAIRVGRSFRVPEQAVHDYMTDSLGEALKRP